MKKSLLKVGGVITAVSGITLGLASTALAAADAEIVNASADVATGMKENMLGILTNAIFLGILVGVPALFFGIRLARRWVFRSR